MARQCSFTKHWEFEECLVCNPDSLYHFAKLVAVAAASKEREACAQMAWDYGWKRVDSDDAQGAAVEITDLIRARGEA
jgi:hypothetical protein